MGDMKVKLDILRFVIKRSDYLLFFLKRGVYEQDFEKP